MAYARNENIYSVELNPRPNFLQLFGPVGRPV